MIIVSATANLDKFTEIKEILSKSVDHICVSYSKLEKYFPISKLNLTGNPVRKEIYMTNIHLSEHTRPERISYALFS